MACYSYFDGRRVRTWFEVEAREFLGHVQGG